MADPAIILTADLKLNNLTTAERQIREFERRVLKNLGNAGTPLGKLTGNVSEFDKSLAAANARVIAFGASVGIISGITFALKQMAVQTIQVEKALLDINVLLNESGSGLKKFSEGLFSVAKNTGASFAQAAEAAKEFSRQGLSAEDTLLRTNDAMILTRLSGLELSKSVDTLTASINQFSKEGITSAEVINRLANVDAKFAVSARDLAEGLARAGGVAQDAGVSFNELTALITSVKERTGRDGAVIGNALKTIFTRLQRTDTLDALEELGIGVRNVAGQTLDAERILGSLAQRYSTLSSAQKALTSELVGGAYQINIVKSLFNDLGQVVPTYARVLDVANRSTDEAYKRNEALSKSISSLANEATVNLTSLAVGVGKLTFEPAARKVLEFFNGKFTDGEEGKEWGTKLGEGVASGFGAFLSGPGLIYISALLLKLTGRFAGFAKGSLGNILGVGGDSGALHNNKLGLDELSNRRPEVAKLLLSTTISQAQKEAEILAIIKQQVVAEEQLALVKAATARGLSNAGAIYSPSRQSFKVKAGGYSPVPIGSLGGEAIASEMAGARSAGYSINPGDVKAMRTTIDGKATTVVYNSKEKVIHDYMGSGEPAIIPPTAGYKNYFGGFKTNTGGLSASQYPSLDSATKSLRSFLTETLGISSKKLPSLDFSKFSRKGYEGLYTPRNKDLINVYSKNIIKNRPNASKEDIDHALGNVILHEGFHAGFDKNPKGATNFFNEKSESLIKPGSNKNALKFLENYYGKGGSKGYEKHAQEEVMAIQFPEIFGYQRYADGYVNLAKKGNLPRVGKKGVGKFTKDGFGGDVYKHPLGDAALDIQGSTAYIEGFDVLKQGAGHSSTVYADMVQALKKRKIKQSYGILLPQEGRAPRDNSAKSQLLARFPQVAWSRYGKSSIFSVGDEKLKIGPRSLDNARTANRMLRMTEGSDGAGLLTIFGRGRVPYVNASLGSNRVRLPSNIDLRKTGGPKTLKEKLEDAYARARNGAEKVAVKAAPYADKADDALGLVRGLLGFSGGYVNAAVGVNLASFSREDLLGYAKKIGVDIPKSLRQDASPQGNAQIANAIRNSQKYRSIVNKDVKRESVTQLNPAASQDFGRLNTDRGLTRIDLISGVSVPTVQTVGSRQALEEKLRQRQELRDNALARAKQRAADKLASAGDYKPGQEALIRGATQRAEAQALAVKNDPERLRKEDSARRENAARRRVNIPGQFNNGSYTYTQAEIKALVNTANAQNYINSQKPQQASFQPSLTQSVFGSALNPSLFALARGGGFSQVGSKISGAVFGNATTPEQQAKLAGRSQKAFGASFLAPAIFGGAAGLVGDNEGKDGRLSRGLSGVGSAIGTGASIAALFPGPAGLAVGALLGGFLSLKSVVDNVTPSLSDLKARVDEINQVGERSAQSGRDFAQTQNALASEGLTDAQRQRLGFQSASKLSNSSSQFKGFLKEGGFFTPGISESKKAEIAGEATEKEKDAVERANAGRSLELIIQKADENTKEDRFFSVAEFFNAKANKAKPGTLKSGDSSALFDTVFAGADATLIDPNDKRFIKGSNGQIQEFEGSAEEILKAFGFADDVIEKLTKQLAVIQRAAPLVGKDDITGDVRGLAKSAVLSKLTGLRKAQATSEDAELARRSNIAQGRATSLSLTGNIAKDQRELSSIQAIRSAIQSEEESSRERSFSESSFRLGANKDLLSGGAVINRQSELEQQKLNSKLISQQESFANARSDAGRLALNSSKDFVNSEVLGNLKNLSINDADTKLLLEGAGKVNDSRNPVEALALIKSSLSKIKPETDDAKFNQSVLIQKLDIMLANFNESNNISKRMEEVASRTLQADLEAVENLASIERATLVRNQVSKFINPSQSIRGGFDSSDILAGSSEVSSRLVGETKRTAQARRESLLGLSPARKLEKELGIRRDFTNRNATIGRGIEQQYDAGLILTPEIIERFTKAAKSPEQIADAQFLAGDRQTQISRLAGAYAGSSKLDTQSKVLSGFGGFFSNLTGGSYNLPGQAYGGAEGPAGIVRDIRNSIGSNDYAGASSRLQGLSGSLNQEGRSQISELLPLLRKAGILSNDITKTSYDAAQTRLGGSADNAPLTNGVYTKGVDKLAGTSTSPTTVTVPTTITINSSAPIEGNAVREEILANLQANMKAVMERINYVPPPNAKSKNQ